MRVNDVNKLIGLRLQAERKKQGLTLEEVGRRIGTSLQAVAHHENGRTHITVVRLLAFCKALKQPITFFLEGKAK